MRRYGASVLIAVVVAALATTGCAPSEPGDRTGAPASASVRADVESRTPSPEPTIVPDGPGSTSPSVAAEESAGNAETTEPDAGRDQPAVKAPRPVGVSLSELEAMTLDPLEESRMAGIDVRTEPRYGMTPGRGFVQDDHIVTWWVPELTSDDYPAIPGFVVGYRQFAYAENGSDDSKGDAEREKYRQFLSVGVLAFNNEAQAREYVDWLPAFALDRADKPDRASLEAARMGAVLWRSSAKGHFLDVALIPQGNLVGEVVTRGFDADGHGGAIKPQHWPSPSGWRTLGPTPDPTTPPRC